LATTTSAENSGLLNHLLPLFEKETGIKVKVVAVGSGKALKLGMDAQADILLVHSRDAEEEFMHGGYGVSRHSLMYNDFVLVGPKSDPLHLRGTKNINDAFTILSNADVKFVSRGDESGTHILERSIIDRLKIIPQNSWYIESGQGMGATLQIANEIFAYTLTDRGTFLSMKSELDFEIMVDKDPKLFNQYSLILVNPALDSAIENIHAKVFYDWLLSTPIQKRIATYGEKEYGQALFVPNANALDD
jgi:tungstate transport system substrate-binding protein